MTIRMDDDVQIVPLALPLDSETVSWLIEQTDGDDAKAARMIAFMLREIRIDDEMMHRAIN